MIVTKEQVRRYQGFSCLENCSSKLGSDLSVLGTAAQCEQTRRTTCLSPANNAPQATPSLESSARSPILRAFSLTRAHHAHIRISVDRQRLLDNSAASLHGVRADVPSSLWHSSQCSSRSLDRSHWRHCRSVRAAE